MVDLFFIFLKRVKSSYVGAFFANSNTFLANYNANYIERERIGESCITNM